MKAVWGIDYDNRNDKCYPHPCCPDCGEIIVRKNGVYHCISCATQVELDPDMEAWFKKREGKKTELIGCAFCGGDKCVEATYCRNKNTLKWQMMGGKCRKCGSRFIV